jgi:hypothetical protein
MIAGFDGGLGALYALAAAVRPASASTAARAVQTLTKAIQPSNPETRHSSGFSSALEHARNLAAP